MLQGWSTTVDLGATRIILFRLSPAQRAEMEVSMLSFLKNVLLILTALLNSF